MRRYAVMIFLLITMLYLVADDSLQWQENGLPLIVSSHIRWNGGHARDADGNEMLVWTEAVNGNHDLFGMRLDADGQNAWDEPRLLYDGKESMIDPKIELSTDGDLFVSWLSGYSDDDQHLECSKFDWEGSMLWTEPVDLSPVVYDFENSKMIADNNGGVYMFWDYSGDWFVQRLDEGGIPVWNPETLQIFNQNSSMYSDQTLQSDGQGGFLAAFHVYGGQGNGFMTGIVRVLPDGSMPWGDDGYILLPVGDNQKLYRYNENEFALLSITDDSEQSLLLYRFNLDGETLTDEPLQIAQELNWSSITDIAGDAEGNLYVEWLSGWDTYNVNTVKITPDNEFSWDEPFTHDNVLSQPRQMNIGLDPSGNVYQSWMSGGGACVQILKLNPNGELVWSATPLDAPNNYNTYVDLVMDVGEDDASLYWADSHDKGTTIYKQKFSGEGTMQWEGDERIVRQGSDCSIQDIHEAQNAGDELFFAWMNNDDGSCFLQNVHPDGETGFLRPGFKFTTNDHRGNQVVAVEPLGDGYLIVWVEADIEAEVKRMYANQFDSQGNRQWSEDLTIAEFDLTMNGAPYEAITDLRDGELLVCWARYTDAWVFDIMAQKIIDGQLAWEEPVLVRQSNNIGDIKIIGDFVLDIDTGTLRVTHLDDNGEISEGWDEEGIYIDDMSSFQRMFAQETSEGLLIVWWDYFYETDVVKHQIVHEDGTKKWDSNPILINHCSGYCMKGYVVDDILYLAWMDQTDLSAQVFDLDGNPLWMLPIAVDSEVMNLQDICPTSEGILLTYTMHRRSSYSYEVMLNHVDMDCELWDSPRTICNAQGSRYNVNIIPAEDDQYFITWRDRRDVISGYSYFAQLYEYQPVGNDDPQLVPQWTPGLTTYPNPFNPETTVQFSLASKAKVELHIYNVKGQRVRTLCDEVLPIGRHRIKWDGTDQYDGNVSSGVYLINLEIDGKCYRSKSLLLK